MSDRPATAAVPSDSVTAELPGPPRWAVALDALSLVALAAALFVAVAGRGLLLGTGQIVLPSSAFLLFLSLATLVVRHVAQPRPPIGRSLSLWYAHLDARPHVANAVRAFVATRPLVFLVAYFAVVTFGFPKTVGFTLSNDPLGNLPARFDAGWYGGIALNGYQWDRQFGAQRNIAFFPALPLLMRPVGYVLGTNHPTQPGDKRMLRALWAGVIVSLAACLWALYYVSRLAGDLAGERAARVAPLLLAAYPFAVFFNAPYTESLFLLGSVGAFHHFHRREWLKASLFGILVGLSRPNGCLVSIPLGVLALAPLIPFVRDGKIAGIQSQLRPTALRLTVAAMPGLAMLAFTAYLYNLTGVWLAWARMHGAWGRKWGTGPLAQGWEWLTTEGLMAVFQGVPFDTINTLAVLFAFVLLWPVFRLLGLAYALFVIVNIVPPVFAGGALSLGRITSTLFPVFIVLAMRIPPASTAVWTAAFALLQGFVAAIFFTWRELF